MSETPNHDDMAEARYKEAEREQNRKEVASYWELERQHLIGMLKGKDSDIATMQAALAEQSDKLKQQEATIRHRDELLGIQSASCERHKYALEEILEHIPVKPTLPIIFEIRSIAETALQETNEQSASTEAATQPDATSGGFTGVASSIKKHITKHNEIMAIMLINGNECVAFPRTWLQYRNVLESGKELQIVAQEDYSRGYLQMIIQHAELLHSNEDESETE